LIYPIFFDNVIALIRNNNPLEKNNNTTIYLSDGRVNFSTLTPMTLRKRYYTLLKNERSS
jgi:hypothetical protein